MSNATIYDVAGKAQVSLATVSRVLNNPNKVNESTRERVLAAIKELGYRPNAIARGLASRKTTTVGVVLSDVTRASTSQLLGGIIDIAKKYNYSIKLYSIASELDIEETIKTVVSEQVDGILFLDDELSNEQMASIKKQLEDANIPIVLTNVVYEDTEVPCVAVDYKKAAYDITKKLIDSGRKDIYLLSTVRRYTVNVSKEAGYIEAMKEAGREIKIFKTSGDILINTPHFEEYFKTHKVDAAIAVRDSIAVSFMNVIEDLGYIVPDDCAVMGFQNTKYAKLARPSLTCVDTPVYDIGAVAMRLLTKIMKDEEVDNINIRLPYNVIKRKSA